MTLVGRDYTCFDSDEENGLLKAPRDFEQPDDGIGYTLMRVVFRNLCKKRTGRHVCRLIDTLANGFISALLLISPPSVIRPDIERVPNGRHKGIQSDHARDRADRVEHA